MRCERYSGERGRCERGRVQGKRCCRGWDVLAALGGGALLLVVWKEAAGAG